MKYLAVLCFIFVFFEAEARHRRRYEAEEHCTAELHLNRSKMKALVNEDNTPEDNQKDGEFLVCVFRKRGVLNENGTVNENSLQNFLQLIFFDGSVTTEEEKKTVQHVLEQCRDIQRASKKKTAIKLKNCITKYIKEFDSEF